MSRTKTFDSSGIAPGGRLYSGDLNAIQDHYADLSNFLQQIDSGTYTVGDSSIQLTKYATGEARLSAALRVDGIVRSLGGAWIGQYADGSALPAGFRPYGVTIFNTTKNRLETNIGTDATPVWVSSARGLADTDISATAAIAYTKLALAGSITNADVSATAAIAKTKLAALNIVNADVAAGAAIAKSKLAALAIVDADVAAGAAIAKAKLAPLAIVNADINAGAAIAVAKLAAGSNGQVLMTTGGIAAWGSMTGVWGGSYPVVTADISDGAVTSLKIADGTIVDADVSATAAIAKSKLGPLAIADADIAAGAAISKAKLASLNIVDSDVDPAAAISKSKLAALNIVNADVSATAAIAKTKLAPLAIVDADVSASAAIAKSKLAPLAIVDADVAGGAAIALTKIEAVSPAGGSFPGSPYDGQRYTYIADGPTGVMWEMRFRNTTSKWEFIGGSNLYFLRDAADTTSSTSYQDIFVSLTAPFAGVYEINFGGVIERSGGGTGYIGVQVGATAPIEVVTNIPPNSTVIEGEFNQSLARTIRVTVASPATVIKLLHRSADGTPMTTRRKFLALKPITT